MLEFQLPGMEELLRYFVFLFEQLINFSVAVLIVANNRVADFREMDAALVGAAGLGRDFYEGGIFQFFDYFEF